MAKKTPRALRLLSWNCYVANKRVRQTLERWIIRYRPDAIYLSEARTHRGALEEVAREMSYTLIQEQPVTQEGEPINDIGDSAWLVRKGVDIELVRRRTAKMRLHWTVFRYNRVHTPRRFEVVALRMDRHLWRLRGSHWATKGNKLAQAESIAKSIAWMLRSQKSSAIDVGDLNVSGSTLRKAYRRVFKIVGAGVDWLIGYRIGSVAHKTLSKGGSDHHGQLYTISPK